MTKEANELRKKGEYDKALEKYRVSYRDNENKYAAAGILNCLRKLGLFEEAVKFASEVKNKYLDFDWCKNEVVWTYIQGKLVICDEKSQLDDIIGYSERILNLNPGALAKKVVVFKVLKAAKLNRRWDIINEWVLKITQDEIKNIPEVRGEGKKDWSDLAIWCNYRINGLLKINSAGEESIKNANNAIEIIDTIIDDFPKLNKYFLRLKAIALHKAGRSDESEKTYYEITSHYKSDWWILYEYAKMIPENDEQKLHDKLNLMCQAALIKSSPNLMVNLFEDIGVLCRKHNKNDEARTHFILVKSIREKNSWNVPQNITKNISELNNILGHDYIFSSTDQVMNDCKTFWLKHLGIKDLSKQVRKNIEGKVELGNEINPFCFIKGNDKQSYYCLKKNLPSETKNNEVLIFDAIPSFDKKKNKESWRAVNIKTYNI